MLILECCSFCLIVSIHNTWHFKWPSEFISQNLWTHCSSTSISFRLLFHQHRLPLYKNTMSFCIGYVCTQIGLPFNPIEYLVCFSVEWLMSEIHELKDSTVVVDSATPEVCYNLICFLCWKIRSSLLMWY